MQPPPTTDLRRAPSRWLAAALVKARAVMTEGLSARAHAIIGAAPREERTDRRSSAWSNE